MVTKIEALGSLQSRTECKSLDSQSSALSTVLCRVIGAEKKNSFPVCLPRAEQKQNCEAIKTSISSSFGEGNGTPLQYSCLENPMD